MFSLYLLLTLATAAASYTLALRIQTYIRRRTIINENGCQLPPRLPSKDPLSTLDRLLESCEAMKRREYLKLVQKRFEEVGNTYRSTHLGATVINTIEPENIRTILSTKFEDYSIGDRKAALEPLIGHGIFTADGAVWEKARRLIRPAFARGEVANLSVLETHVQKLVNTIKSDEPVDLQKNFYDFTIDYSSAFLLGEPVKAGDETRDFGNAFDRCQQAVVKFWALGPFAAFLSKRKFKRDVKTVNSYVDQFVKLQLTTSQHESMPNKSIFIRELSKHVQDPEIIRSGLLNLLIAGRDTSAALLSNLFFTIAKRPDIFTKLKNEVAVLNGQNPTLEDLKKLPYLKACINESLRLHPVVPWNSRIAIHDTILPIGGGKDGKSPIFIPSGTCVAYQVFSMHRRKDIFGEDADDFNPERWEGLRPGWGYLPFNGGPRICLGMQFALNEVSYVLARLCQELETVESRDEREWFEGLGITCTLGNGCLVKLTKVGEGAGGGSE